MLDLHEALSGSQKILIFGIPAYTFFVSLGMLAGLTYYLLDVRRRGRIGEGALVIIAAALVFGILGSKVPLLFEGRSLPQIIFGKSIVGGLIGGMFGVYATKRLFKIQLRLGNVIAPAVALGMAIGRLGCFFTGCCYGKVAAWGFDFGDGLTRLPTQLFESAFHLIAFCVLLYWRDRAKTPGILFKLYLLAYFVFRFCCEFIRENPIIFMGLTVYQIICLLGIAYIAVVLFLDKHRSAQAESIAGL